MKKNILVFGLLAFILFGYYSKALAECGWVLWLKKETVYFPEMKEYISWDIVFAYPKFNQCTEGRNSIYKKRKKSFSDREKESRFMEFKADDKTQLLFVDYKGLDDQLTMSETIYYMCLPDTIDPRTKK